jgi:hypothetical protein
MRPVAESVLDLTSRPIDKSVLEVVQNIQSGVAQVIERPKFDVRPITSINRMIEANHKADNARYNALVAKIDGVHVDDGGMKTRLDEIEERVNEQLNGVTQKQDSVSKDVSNKLDMLTKITGGVAIAGGALTLGFLGYKLLKAITGGGNKEEGGRSPARAKVNKRIHARSWGGRNEPLNARSIWDGKISMRLLTYEMTRTWTRRACGTH